MVEHGGATEAKTTLRNGMEYHEVGGTILVVDKGDEPTPPPYNVGIGGGGVSGGWCNDHPGPPPHSEPSTVPGTSVGYCMAETLRREAPPTNEVAQATVQQCGRQDVPKITVDDTCFEGGGSGQVSRY